MKITGICRKIKSLWFPKKINIDPLLFFRLYPLNMTWSQGEARSNLIKQMFLVDPIRVLEMLSSQIEEQYIVSKRLALDLISPETYKLDVFGLIGKGKIDKFNRVTTVSIEEFGIFDSKESNAYDDIYLTNDINGSTLDLELFNVNRFDGSFYVFGTFSGDHMDYDIALSQGVLAKLCVRGIKKQSQSPPWSEYLVDGILNNEGGDSKMAILTLYSAFENFITILHDDLIFEILANKAQKSAGDLRRLRAFAQQKKLFENKTQDVVTFLEMGPQNQGFTAFNAILKDIEKVAKVRHSIAHGAVSETKENVLDIAYKIIVAIYSIGLRRDIEGEDWKGILSTKNL